MTQNQKTAQALFEKYKASKTPAPACVVLAHDSEFTEFVKADIKRIRKLYEY